uniref:Zinc finger PMZ-type domain-containing protein n=1 Tax=Cannabis sativa TaxID=3483 RepID=A0A803PQD8_CANSA
MGRKKQYAGRKKGWPIPKDDENEIPFYELISTFFTLKVHHKGTIDYTLNVPTSYNGGVVEEEFKVNENLGVSSFRKKVNKDHVLEISRHKAYRARTSATKSIEGSYEEQYVASMGLCVFKDKTLKDLLWKAAREPTIRRRWELTGIPCSHVVAVIWHNKQDPELYVSKWYTKEYYMKAYSHQIFPIRIQDEWPRSGKIGMINPIHKKQPGRPKKSRKLELQELVSGKKLKKKFVIIKCSVCGGKGHNLRTCGSNKTTSDMNVVVQAGIGWMELKD